MQRRYHILAPFVSMEDHSGLSGGTFWREDSFLEESLSEESRLASEFFRLYEQSVHDFSLAILIAAAAKPLHQQPNGAKQRLVGYQLLFGLRRRSLVV